MKIIEGKFYQVGLMILLMTLLVACGSGGKAEETDEKEKNDDPKEKQEAPEMTTDEITLKFMMPWGEEMFEALIKTDVEEKFPNITVENIGGTVDASGFDEAFAAQEVPDILLAHNGFDVLKEYDMDFALDDLIEVNAYDLNRFREGLVEIAKSRDPYGEGKLYGLPFEDMLLGLYYNPEVFDLFGVDYPTDGMTWDEILVLAKQVSAERNGVNYRGLTFATPWHYSLPLSQRSVHGTDPETGEVLFDKSDDFTKYLSLIQQIADLPGNEDGISGAFGEGNVAMVLNHLTAVPSYAEVEGLDFKIVSFPVWSDLPDAAPYKFIGQTLAIGAHSEYKQEAFKVIDYLTSHEKQTINARLGRLSTLKDPTVMDEFLAEDFPNHDFNVQGALAITPAAPPVYTKWGPEIQLNPNDFYSNILTVDFLESGDDPVTAIRKAKDAYEILVKEKMEQE